jgi:hypothetical protein
VLCDKCGAEGAEPAILTVREDDGTTMDERRLLLCIAHTAELVNAVEVKES